MEKRNSKTKTSKNLLAIAALAVGVIVVMTCPEILANLTEQDINLDTFTVGKVNIKLEEEQGDRDTQANIMKIAKNPKVTNTGENDAFVYLKVRVPKVILKKDDLSTSPLFTYQVNTGWTELKEKVYEEPSYVERLYYYSEGDGKLISSSQTTALFEEVKVADITDDTKYISDDGSEEKLEDEIALNMEVKAYAIETDNLPKGRENVQTAFDVILEY